MTDSGRPHVVAVCGSLRTGSYTHVALRHVLETAEASGATTDLVDLRSLELPVFDPDDRNAGDVPDLRRRIRAGDAIILGTPTYHGSYASPLKTAVDHCGFDEFEGKTVGLLAVSGGRSSYAGPLADLRGVARALRAWVLPHQVGIGAASEVFEGDGTSTDEESSVVDRITTLGRDAVRYASISPGEADAPIADASADD